MKAVIILALLIFAAYLPAFLSHKTFFYGDNYSLMVPGKVLTIESLRRGELPFWNPYQLSGQPFLADISQSVFYPSTVLFLVLPTWIAVNATVFLHMLIGALGVFVIGKSRKVNIWLALIGAVVWLFSMQVTMGANNLSIVQTTAWLPWMYYLTRKVLEERTKMSRVLLVGATVLAVLGGYPQPLSYFGIFLGLYIVFFPGLLWKEKIKKFWISLLLTIGMLAIVLFPFIELSKHSTRVSMSADTVLDGSLPPLQLATWVIPNVFLDLSQGISWGPAWSTLTNESGYLSFMGLVAIGMFACSRKKSYETKVLLITAGVSILVALGKYVPLATLLYAGIPALRLFRNPVIALWLWTFSTSILIVPALAYLAERIKKQPRILINTGFVSAILLCVCAVTLYQWFPALWVWVDHILNNVLSHSTFHTVDRDLVIAQHFLRNLFVVITSSTALLYLLSEKKKRWILVCGVIVLDLFLCVRPSILLAPSTVYEGQSLAAEALRDVLQPGERYVSSTGYLRWTGFPTYWENIAVRPPFQESRFTVSEAKTFAALRARRDNLGPDWGQVNEVATPFGFSTFVLERNAQYWKSADNSNVNEVDMPALTDPRFAQQAVSYLTLDTSLYSKDDLLTEYPNLTLAKEGDGFALFRLPNVLPFIRPEGQASVSAIVVKQNGMLFTVDSNTPASVLIAAQYYPGWTCTASSGNCSIVAADGGMHLSLPTGKNEVVLSFLPTSWARLVAISALSSVGFVLFTFYTWRTRKTR